MNYRISCNKLWKFLVQEQFCQRNIFRCKFVWCVKHKFILISWVFCFIANSYIVFSVFVCTFFFFLHWWIISFFKVNGFEWKTHTTYTSIGSLVMEWTFVSFASFVLLSFSILFHSRSLIQFLFCLLDSYFFVLFFSRLTLYLQFNVRYGKWWCSHKNFALKYRFVSVFRLYSFFFNLLLLFGFD